MSTEATNSGASGIKITSAKVVTPEVLGAHVEKTVEAAATREQNVARGID